MTTAPQTQPAAQTQPAPDVTPPARESPAEVTLGAHVPPKHRRFLAPRGAGLNRTGILALAVGSIGFIGKLFTEAIEEISPKQVEAVRATGLASAPPEDAGGDHVRRQRIREQVGPRALAQQLDHLAPAGGEAAERAAQRLAACR